MPPVHHRTAAAATGESRGRSLRALLPAVGALGLLLALPPAALAHAILLEASPAAKSIVAGPDVAIRLRFNSRIDGARSHLSLIFPDASVRALASESQQAPEVLTARARGLAAGAYRLRWQVLAADGHITRGEVHFRVR
jgi:methionine-rich copper-binding protein CopC